MALLDILTAVVESIQAQYDVSFVLRDEILVTVLKALGYMRQSGNEWVIRRDNDTETVVSIKIRQTPLVNQIVKELEAAGYGCTVKKQFNNTTYVEVSNNDTDGALLWVGDTVWSLLTDYGDPTVSDALRKVLKDFQEEPCD